MRFSLLILAIFSFLGCYSSKEQLQHTIRKQELYPYLTNNGTYIYVDANFTPVLTTEYIHADLFTSTGYALVQNKQDEYAIINQKGETVVPFSKRYLSLQVLTDQLTVVMRRETYTSKSRFWEWEWNIFSGLKTEIARQEFDVFILETNQSLYSEKLSDTASLPSYVQVLDDLHFVFNETLYIRKGKRLIKQANHIIDTFNEQRVLQQNGKQYTILNVNQTQPELKNLQAADQLSFLLDGKKMELKEVNQRRYYSDVPKILYQTTNQTYLIEPQFDKAFPKEIKLQTPEQLDYLQKVTYVNSIPNYPYFILGVFDYDSWSYDWKYVSSTTGQVLDSIDAPDFFVLDVTSRVHRPSTSEIISVDQLPENTTLKKITKDSSLNHLFKIRIKEKEGKEYVGLWNTQSKKWELPPIYQDFYWLDVDLGLLAVAQEENHYTMYNYQTKQTISSIFKYIYSSGWVTPIDTEGEKHQFYFDFKTQKEYREQK